MSSDPHLGTSELCSDFHRHETHQERLIYTVSEFSRAVVPGGGNFGKSVGVTDQLLCP